MQNAAFFVNTRFRTTGVYNFGRYRGNGLTRKNYSHLFEMSKLLKKKTPRFLAFSLLASSPGDPVYGESLENSKDVPPSITVIISEACTSLKTKTDNIGWPAVLIEFDRLIRTEFGDCSEPRGHVDIVRASSRRLAVNYTI